MMHFDHLGGDVVFRAVDAMAKISESSSRAESHGLLQVTLNIENTNIPSRGRRKFIP